MKYKKGFAFYCIMIWCLIFYFSPETMARQLLVKPENLDGFETADWRNFRPNYIGSSTEFIRPRFEITDKAPISGNYSLLWTGDEKEHEWLMLSNAFYLSKPITVSVLFRVEEHSNTWRAGLYLMQDYGFFTGLQLQSGAAAIHIDAKEWNAEKQENLSLEAGTVYELRVSLDSRNRFTAAITDQQSGDRLFEQSGISAVNPGAIALYVKTEAGSHSRLYFDDVTVFSGEYYVESGVWTRAPQPSFVALPRLPDVTQEEGNWVGGHSVIKTAEGDYLMWYRIRDNVQRGKGYGFARSHNGIHWVKFENNPVFVPDTRYASNEKITVLKIDGVFRGWYTVERDGLWITKHIESLDGINWGNDMAVIDDVMCKDADVIYLNGEYFLYCIGPSYTDISVYTSGNGLEWSLRKVYEMGTHRHLAVYFERENSRFALYPTAGAKGVSYAVSDDGIHFEPFVQTWSPPPVGLDDWTEAGITYLSFLRNEHGHIQSEKNLPVYYQARNTYDNNIPGWLYHGGERVVLAGKFDGLYLNLLTRVMPSGSYQYEAFPFEAKMVNGFTVFSDRISDLMIQSWESGMDPSVTGTLTSQSGTLIQFKIENLDPGKEYILELSGDIRANSVVQDNGELILRIILSENGEQEFLIRRK